MTDEQIVEIPHRLSVADKINRGFHLTSPE